MEGKKANRQTVRF